MNKWKELETIGLEYEKQRRILLIKLKTCEEELSHAEDKETIKALEKKQMLLKSMERDVRELERETKRYYEKGWWRSEHYTFNERKQRNHSYAIRHEE